MREPNASSTLDISRYRSDTIKKVTNEKTKLKYLEIYNDYIKSRLNIFDLAKKHNISSRTVSNVLKWVTFNSVNIEDKSITKQVLLDRNGKRWEKLDKLYKEADTTYEKLAILREMRQLDFFEAQVTGTIKDITVKNIQNNKMLRIDGSSEVKQVDQTPKIQIIHSAIHKGEEGITIVDIEKEEINDMSKDKLRGKRLGTTSDIKSKQ